VQATYEYDDLPIIAGEVLEDYETIDPSTSQYVYYEDNNNEDEQVKLSEGNGSECINPNPDAENKDWFEVEMVDPENCDEESAVVFDNKYGYYSNDPNSESSSSASSSS
jgi:hypothetical protein